MGSVAPFQKIVFRDIVPVTPHRYASKAVVGDDVAIGATLVRDGHGILSARVRWRRTPRAAGPGEPNRRFTRWQSGGLHDVGGGRVEGTIAIDEPGDYEFEVQAWFDRFATWRRDLSLRAAAGDDLDLEFEIGARLIERLSPSVPKAERRRLADAVATLRSATCSEPVRLSAGLDDAVAELLDRVVDPDEVATSPRHRLRIDREIAARGAWYEFFPRSEGGLEKGSASWSRLEEIAAAGFDVVYLPPIHPIGTTNRKGRNNTLLARPDDVGSPWAIGSVEGGHTAVHPDLGTIDDVEAFVARVAELGMEVALDYALQCSPDHPWAREHPEWFTQLPDGSIRFAENPPKKYQDIYPINFWPDRDEDRVALWEACRDVLEHWIDHGVNIFRVDNPHTKPVAFWEWMIRDVQGRHPDVVFLAEAFTLPAMMHTLAEVGFSQSYTYFTWRTAKWELEQYGEELARGPAAGYFRPNLWPNTPDILAGPLRNGPPAAFAMRAMLAATMAPSWGVYSGFELFENQPASPDNEEYLHSEKYELKRRDWDRPDSLMPFLARLNAIRRNHPAMAYLGSLRYHHVDNDEVTAYSYHRGSDTVVVIVNINPTEVREATVHLDHSALGLPWNGGYEVHDEITGETFTWHGGGNYVRLDPAVGPGHVLSVVR